MIPLFYKYSYFISGKLIADGTNVGTYNIKSSVSDTSNVYRASSMASAKLKAVSLAPAVTANYAKNSLKINGKMEYQVVKSLDEFNCIVLPGGIPGTPNLNAHSELKKLIGQFNQDNKLLTAICAAPTIYGEMGLLKGKKATCYPGLEDKLLEADFIKDKVAIDGNFITSRGLGTAIDFALAIVEKFKGKDAADEIAQKIVYR